MPELEPTWSNERLAWNVGETNDQWIDIVEMVSSSRIVLVPKGKPEFYDAVWCYGSYSDALAAALKWDPDEEDEPPGYSERIL